MLTVVDGARMQVFHDDVTYPEAVSKCRTLGGVLATPTTPALQQEMLRLINQSGGPIGYGYWIGLTAPVTGVKNFVWSTGQPLVGWSAWGSGQPNNFQGSLQDCVVMKMLAGQRHLDGWNDNNCDEMRNYVCQLPDLDGYTTACTSGSDCFSDEFCIPSARGNVCIGNSRYCLSTLLEACWAKCGRFTYAMYADCVCHCTPLHIE